MLKRLVSIIETAVDAPGSVAAKLRGADARTFAFLRCPWIRDLGIRTVLDVGANIGRWAKACRLALGDVAICSFEPVPSCQDALRTRMREDGKHRVYAFALGRIPGEANMRVHTHAASSSLLVESDELRRLNRHIGTTHEISVKVTTLDSMHATECWDPPFMLKVDVQGFELEVLGGAQKVLVDVAAIVVETSFRTLYGHQPLFEDIHDYLVKSGFAYVGAAESVLRLSNRLEVQQDSVFVRKPVLARLGC
jgi:FkbM family methyltransferase